MENFIIIAIVLVIVILALWYILRAKKRGQKCIGCPYSGENKNGSCPCCISKK